MLHEEESSDFSLGPLQNSQVRFAFDQQFEGSFRRFEELGTQKKMDTLSQLKALERKTKQTIEQARLACDESIQQHKKLSSQFEKLGTQEKMDTLSQLKALEENFNQNTKVETDSRFKLSQNKFAGFVKYFDGNKFDKKGPFGGHNQLPELVKLYKGHFSQYESESRRIQKSLVMKEFNTRGNLGI